MRAFALLFTFLLSSAASAQSLSDALGQFQRGEAEQALASFESLRAEGQQEPAELARIERYLGILYASLGEDSRALQSFSRSLSINPEQSTPQEIGPEQQASFRAAQLARAGGTIDVPVTRAAESYRIRIVGAPEGWVAGMHASYGGQSEEATGDVMELRPSSAEWLGDRLVVRVVARDSFGNVILRRRVELERDRPVESPGSRRGLVLGVIFASLAVVAGGVAAAVLVGRRGDDGFQEGGQVVWELRQP